MKYYQRLRDLREDHEITQKEIAQLLKTTQPQYARYETGERELPMHHFRTLAKYYNVSLDYLVGREFVRDIGYLSEEQKSTVQKLQRLDENSLALADAYIEGLIDKISKE